LGHGVLRAIYFQILVYIYTCNILHSNHN